MRIQKFLFESFHFCGDRKTNMFTILADLRPIH